MSLINNIKIIREHLLTFDEPIKAYNMLKELNIPELKPELDKTYGMIRHIYDPVIYDKVYGKDGEFNVYDVDLIEPDRFTLCAETRYDRYKWVLEGLVEDKAESFLDLACYVGSLVNTASYKGIKSYGVDLTKDAIKIATERATKNNLDSTFFVDNIETFYKVKADVVSAFEVLEHVVDPEAFIKHISSLANKWVYITTPDGSFDYGLGNLGVWEWDGNEAHVRGHVRAFRKDSLFKLLDKCGCEIAFLDAMPNEHLLYAKFRRKDL
jgi:hypothetical protein